MSYSYNPLDEDDTNEPYDKNLALIPETESFAKFITIDKLVEADRPISDIKQSREVFASTFQAYRGTLWEKSKTFVTLTCIAILIGCFAGFIQIFTETLGNWKTGHCARNWFLNKSFCCTDVVLEEMSKRSPLLKRQEMECIEQGIWVERTGIFFPFITFFIFSLCFALASTLLVKYIAPMATGSGISEIKVWVSGFIYESEFLNGITLLVKSISLPLAISSGLSIGKEGPSVHYATCCGFIVTRWLLKDSLTYSDQFEYLTAASGAGVAVAFGAPIGGVLFGLEEISSATDFNASTLWKSYYVALIAVTTLKCIDPFRNGKIILFNVTYDKNWKVMELPIFIVLGIFGGLYGKYISRWNIRYVHFRKQYLKNWPIQEVMVLALVTAFISYFNEFLKLDMTESMGVLFHECSKNDNSSIFAHRLCQLDENTHFWEFSKALCSLLFATLIRSLFVIISYGAKVPAGIFVPSMAIGATFGRAVSLIVERFVTGANVITPGAYAFLGAAAALTGITNLTLTVVVIMLELTGAFIYIIPTMIVVAISRIILTSSGTAGGIADQMILVNGFPLLEYESEDKEDDFMTSYTTGEIMSTDLYTLSETMYLSDLEVLLNDPNKEKLVNGFPIISNDYKVKSEMRCVGYVLKRHLIAKVLQYHIDSSESSNITINFTTSEEALTGDNEISFKDIVNLQPTTVKPNVTTAMLFKTFKHMGCKAIMVEQDGLLKGLITSKDIQRFERAKSREKFGPTYIYNEDLNRKFWSLLNKVINIFSQNDVEAAM
ncbi:similar to Saccharomyces cerevisiae YJR040W GEF1 Voltage-gated chloride channel localized to the golgi, the endosomal system, and plasma membrane, and involved in cation homeostasis [Maudiozyma saulgeensis]|uniref:Similar to Saccharomyces cerevisiae YJR040W GEF1 Voltage-gated chloride channel localized to the golgi, the endosomal system, and plasma membrane, and involved in cation homeostasis n=1 Tax=Maudiozyma saulgeensis TaxID=1789683 RepID=A0A1X7R110_9SACH|nr:similar to Saccharomyces cerevisiae YJR040W GEF1 Voltage-gated chloride channel localized to the golgi, the endosomal system, and plasma membrane, and involved in cation homeostasis [Kazachstania saulgeensis]